MVDPCLYVYCAYVSRVKEERIRFDSLDKAIYGGDKTSVFGEQRWEMSVSAILAVIKRMTEYAGLGTSLHHIA